MKRIFIISALLIFLCSSALADEFRIPFSCYPLSLQKAFAEHNLKLDLDPNERTEYSFGFLKSEGSRYIIYTYRTATTEEMELILKIVQEEVIK